MKTEAIMPHRFGIELEISRRLVCVSYQDKRKNNTWLELNERLLELINKKQISSGWKLKVDTSCGGEIVSPPLSVFTGFREVARVCSMIKKVAAAANKPAVDGECGLHLHFDASTMTPKTLGNLFALLHVAEPVIYEMYPTRNKSYCAPIDINIGMTDRFRDWIDIRDQWYRPQNNVKDKTQLYSNDFINSDIAGNHYDGTRYHGFNIHCFWSIGTIEFRYAAGTIDIVEIIAYYEMCKSLIQAAVSNKKITMGEKFKNYHLDYAITLLKSKPGSGRKYISELYKFCKFSRNTMRFMMNSLKKNRSFLLERANSVKYIGAVNCSDYLYSLGGLVYDHLGIRVLSNPELKRIIPCREHTINGYFISLDKKFCIDIPIFVNKPVESV